MSFASIRRRLRDATHDPRRRRLRGPNIPIVERALTAAAGAALAGLALRRRGVLGGVLAGLGATLIARAAAGRDPLYRRLALRHGVDVRGSVTIDRPRHEVYVALRDLRRAPRFLSQIDSVVERGATAAWTADRGPVTIEWISEITEERPDQRLAWRAIPGSALEHEGAIELADVPGGTRVTIALRFEPPRGPFAGPLEGLYRNITRRQLAADLERLRGQLETHLPPFDPARYTGVPADAIHP